MLLAATRQDRPGETRVPLTPQAVRKLVGQKLQVLIEAGAGQAAGFEDAAYTDAGATLVTGDAQSAQELWAKADLIVTIHAPRSEQVQAMKPGAALLGFWGPLKSVELVKTLAQRKITSFSLEFLPRISRAQSMDVLSSQANIGGYEAVILGAQACPKMFPMLITAAGTIAPAKVLVIGAGVAGLQAIATAKRLGAVVEAYDVRPEVEEQVKSLGGRFIKLPTTSAEATAAGGYAKEQSEEQRRQQVALMTKHVIENDVVITTAAVFGKAPPMLIPAEVVGQMRRGTVIVDLAADVEAGRGNCQLTQPDKTFTTERGVTLIGHTNLPALAPVHASQMYANNMLAFLAVVIKDGQLKLDLSDEVHKGVLITHEGQVVQELVAKAAGAEVPVAK